MNEDRDTGLHKATGSVKPLLVRTQPLLTRSWDAFGTFSEPRGWSRMALGVVVGRSWGAFRAYLAVLGRSWGALGRSWGDLKSLLGRLGTLLGRFWPLL